MAKVLLVEDDPSLLKVYAAEFTVRGYEVLSADNGEKALETALSSKPDYIVLDLMLPKMSGLIVLEKLKQNTLTQAIPVSIVTNFGQEDNVSQALKIGAEDVILKYQATPAEIVQKVTEYLARIEANKKGKQK